MKASINWLKDYVAIDIPADKLIHRLTMAGLEVEHVEKKGGDTVFEMEITPNRPDCLSMIGIAREVSAILNKPLKKPAAKVSLPRTKTQITVKDKKACSRYIGIVVEGVKVGVSPKWLKTRIEALGLRSINNVVDITNFCLMEWGQPLHAFDYDKLGGNKIIVRRGAKGETLTTLDGEKRETGPDVLVIADNAKPVALAGVMGGENTEVTPSTKNIFLESASFDPVLIRRTVRALGLASDSSYRFERGIDSRLVKEGALRAVSLILQEAGGKITAYHDTGSVRTAAVGKIAITPDQIRDLLGADIPASRCKNILKKLECSVTGSGQSLKVAAPVFRNDLKEPVDLIEEIARVIGYDNLPSAIPQIKAVNVAPESRWDQRTAIRGIMTGLGLNEIITYTMTSGEALARAGEAGVKGIEVVNPISQDHRLMRPSTLPNILDVVLTNINRGQKDFRFFELGKVFFPGGERETLSVVMTGPRANDWLNKENRQPVNFYDLKGIFDALFQRLGIPADYNAADDGAFESGRAARILVKGKPAGTLGAVCPNVLKNCSIKHDHLLYARLDLETVYPLIGAAHRRYRRISDYPPVTRDVSLAVDKDISFADMTAGIREKSAGLLKDIVFIEEYLGEKIAGGRRGLVFSLVYQSDKRTLTEDEVQKIHDTILEDIIYRTKAVVR